MLLNLKTKSRGNFQLSTYLNVFDDSDKLDRAGDTQAICVDVKCSIKLVFKKGVLTDHRQADLPWQDMGWMWQILSASGGEEGDQGDQTGAKQIIGRLQVGKTIGQLD